MIKTYKILSVMAIFMGTGHTVLTPVFYDKFDINAIWFAGAGLGLLCLGFLNFASTKCDQALIKIFCFLGNLLFLIFTVLILKFETGPQVFIVIAILTSLLAINLRDLINKLKEK